MTRALAYCILTLIYTGQLISPILVRGNEIEDMGVLYSNDTGDQEARLSMLYDICNQYNTCNQTDEVPDHVQPLLSCCVPCTCDDNCYAMGSCCRDKAGDPSLSSSGEILSEDGEVCSTILPSTDVNGDESAYLMVKQCKPQYKGEAKRMCAKADRTTLDDLTPIVSMETGLTYWNSHCARCNDQEQTESFLIIISCDSYLPLYPFQNIDSMLQDGCQIRWLQHINSTKCMRAATTDDCVGSRYPTLCNSIPEGTAFVKALESNVCYMGCGVPLPDVCPALFSPTDKGFEALLTWDMIAATYSLVSELEANVKENDIHYTCSPSQIKTTGKQCQACIGIVKGVCLDHRLRVTISNSPSIPIHLLKSELGVIFRPNFRPITSNKIDVLNIDDNEYFVTYNIRILELFLKNYTFYTNVPDSFQTFENNMKYNNLQLDIAIEHQTTGLAFTPQPLEEVGYLSYADSFTTYGCEKMIAMDDIQFCDMVMFAPEEYRIRSGVVVLKDGREFRSHEYVLRRSRDGDEYVQICFAIYELRLPSSSGSSVKANTCPGVIILALCTLMYSCIHNE